MIGSIKGSHMEWKLRQDMDVGTNNPIVARMSLGIFEIIELSSLSKDKKEDLKSSCYEIMKLLVLAEKNAKPIIKEIERILAEITKAGISTQSQGRCINVPSALNIEHSRSFIKYAKQVLQKVAENINIIFGKSYKGPYFDKIRDDFIKEFGSDFIVTKLLIDDQSWIKEIIDLRNEDEHSNTGKPYCSNFDVNRDKDGKFVVTLPKFFNGIQIANGLEVYSHNLLTFAEEITAYSLGKLLPDMVTIYEIPEDRRNIEAPIRFRVGLKTDVIKMGNQKVE